MREAPLGEEPDEGPEHREFFERPEPWQGHWNNNYAPKEWHATPAELIERNDFWKVYSDCLSPLPQRTASAFTLREVDGLKSEEICEILSIKVNNLWVMLHRARLHLRNCLELNWFRPEQWDGAENLRKTKAFDSLLALARLTYLSADGRKDLTINGPAAEFGRAN